jgi:hypothetical protein
MVLKTSKVLYMHLIADSWRELHQTTFHPLPLSSFRDKHLEKHSLPIKHLSSERLSKNT